MLVEASTAHWHIMNEEPNFYYEKLLEIRSIRSDSILVNGYTFPLNEKSEIELQYNEEYTLNSTIQISDGYHFSHTIKFSTKE